MPTEDAYGRTVPVNTTDAPDLEGMFRAFSLSTPPGPVTVTSRAQANALRTAAGNPTGLHVWQSDVNQEFRWNGSTWEYVAGRQHGATVRFSSLIPEGTVGTLEAQELLRYSTGWTINADGYLVVPQTGFYGMYAVASATGAASSMGAAFFRLALRSGAFGGRAPMTSQDNAGHAALWPFTAGDQLRIQGYHEGGGGRTWSATLQILMLNAPSW